MVYTFFFKLLVILSILLIIVLCSKNINEFYTNSKSINTPPSISIKSNLVDNHIVLTWTRPDDVYVKEYVIEVYIDDDIKPHFIFPKNLKEKYCKYTLDGFDETKNYKFGVYMVNQDGDKGLIESFSELKNLKHMMHHKSKNKDMRFSCNVDGSYTISKGCNNNNYVKSNYSESSYKQLKKDLEKQKYSIDINFV